jgi:hypothetical protein
MTQLPPTPGREVFQGGERLRHLEDCQATDGSSGLPPGACRRCQEWKLPSPGTPRDIAGAQVRLATAVYPPPVTPRTRWAQGRCWARREGQQPYRPDPCQGTHPGLLEQRPTRRTVHRHRRRGKASGLPLGGARRNPSGVQEEPVAPPHPGSTLLVHDYPRVTGGLHERNQTPPDTPPISIALSSPPTTPWPLCTARTTGWIPRHCRPT